MTNHLAEIKKALWKAKQPMCSDTMRSFYVRHAARLQREYDRLQKDKNDHIHL